MSYETRDRLSQSEITDHPWLKDSNGVTKGNKGCCVKDILSVNVVNVFIFHNVALIIKYERTNTTFY